MFRFGIVRNALTALVVGVALAGTASAGTDKPFFEKNVDRWGADYSIFDVTSGGANTCYQACAKDKQCLAWTFHRPGSKGKLGECHLKSKVSHGRSNPCCISGVLIGQDTAASADKKRSAVISGRRMNDRHSRLARSAAAPGGIRGLFRKASLTPGEAVGLPELTAVAIEPPLKITPVSFNTSDEF